MSARRSEVGGYESRGMGRGGRGPGERWRGLGVASSVALDRAPRPADRRRHAVVSAPCQTEPVLSALARRFVGLRRRGGGV